MSVNIVLKMAGNTQTFLQALDDRAQDFVEISNRGKAAGAIHHQFAVGDGYVVVIDEWESADRFQAFFEDPELQKFIGEVGGDMSTQPEVLVGEAIDSPDRF